MSDISTLTLIGNATRSPIRHTLAKEKLTNDIQNTVNHSTTPLSTTPTPPMRRAGTKNAHAPRRGAHATLTSPTIARQHSYAQPRQRRQHGKTRHIKGKGRAPEQIRQARPQMLYLHVAGQDKDIITCKRASAQPDNTRANCATRGSLGDGSNHATRQGDNAAVPRAHHNRLTLTIR